MQAGQLLEAEVLQPINQGRQIDDVSSLPSISVLGSRVHMIDIPAVIEIISHWIRQFEDRRICRQIIVTGFHGLWESHKNEDFKAILNSADLWVPDGIAPVWIARLKGVTDGDRTPGADIMRAYFERANQKGYRSFFYGDTEETLDALKTKLEKKYPCHKIVGMYSPPFRPLTPEEDEDIIRIINDAKPDVLWVGLGLLKQDRWISEHKERLKVPVAMGVGAAFGFHSEKVKRVPDWIGKNGLEWVWRFIQEPKKLWRRDLIDGPQFVWHVLLELSGLRKYE